jgi:hypothetical protein
VIFSLWSTIGVAKLFSLDTADIYSWDEFEQPTFEAQGERGSQDSVLHSRVRYKLL